MNLYLQMSRFVNMTVTNGSVLTLQNGKDFGNITTAYSPKTVHTEKQRTRRLAWTIDFAQLDTAAFVCCKSRIRWRSYSISRPEAITIYIIVLFSPVCPCLPCPRAHVLLHI